MAPKSVTFRRHDHLVSVLFEDLLSHSYNITFSMFLDLVQLKISPKLLKGHSEVNCAYPSLIPHVLTSTVFVLIIEFKNGILLLLYYV